METNAPDAQLPADRGGGCGWGMWIALAVVGLALVVLLVLPGFIASGFSRTGGHFVSAGGEFFTSEDFPESKAFLPRAELVVLTPANWLMMRSEPIRRLYVWEYNLAGGPVDNGE